MKMIRHQTVSESGCNRVGVFQIQLKEVVIIAVFAEEILSNVAAVVDVIDATVFERDDHGDPPHV